MLYEYHKYRWVTISSWKQKVDTCNIRLLGMHTCVTGCHVFRILVFSSTIRQFTRKLEVADCLQLILCWLCLVTMASANLTANTERLSVSSIYKTNLYDFCFQWYIHCVSKKRPTFKLSLTLLNLNRFSKFLHCWKAHEICYKSHMTMPTLP